ncbi:hypothetical protein ACFQ69_33655 [Streptomyces sp. NPDC056470]|uniref:hypothetical protein n=1 Tax=Streptomyces sp. NPDC056470 TaxID=3345831 RepID=UPI0036855255
MALALAHVHGRLAWFLGAAATTFTPVLHWRALPSDDDLTFGAVKLEPEQYTEAEDAIRRLQSTSPTSRPTDTTRLSPGTP